MIHSVRKFHNYELFYYIFFSIPDIVFIMTTLAILSTVSILKIAFIVTIPGIVFTVSIPEVLC